MGINEKKGQAGLVVFLGIVIIILLNIIIFVGVGVEAFQICQDVQVAYEITEFYHGFLDGKIVAKDRKNEVNFIDEVTAVSKIRLQNTDNKGGLFIVTFVWELDEFTLFTADEHYIVPGEVRSFRSDIDIQAGDDWEVSQFYETQLVQKSRIVTKYRTERRCG